MQSNGRCPIEDETQADRSSAIPLADKVAFLSSPTAYSPVPPDVQAEESHMSWVFLAGERVYKLKKPVRYPFLDFGTLAAREHNCREELRLNRRLAPDTYLGVVPLTADGDGLAIGGAGCVVDWLVVMRRLPARRMLDAEILGGTVTDEAVRAVGRRLATFHAAEAPAALTAEAYVAQFAREHADSRRVLADPHFGLADEAASVLDMVATVIEERPELLRARLDQGCIVEGHGDLRAEHVCLADPPVVIDCLEFNRALRLVDPIDELVNLGTDCERLGAAWIGPALIAEASPRFTAQLTSDLLWFYRAYRTCVRARLAVVHLLEPDVRQRGKWQPLARHHLNLAVDFDVMAYLRAAR